MPQPIVRRPLVADVAPPHHGMKAIPRKSHGRREKSWFCIGLGAFRNRIVNRPKAAAHAWLEKAPRRSMMISKHP